MRRLTLLPILALFMTAAGCAEGQKANPLPSALKAEAAPSGGLYERLGGEAGVHALVERFALHVRVNEATREDFKGRFEGDAGAALKKKLAFQIGALAGGPAPGTGKSLKGTHAGLGIGPADFDAMLADLRRALDDQGIDPADRDELLRRFERLRAAVVEKAP